MTRRPTRRLAVRLAALALGVVLALAGAEIVLAVRGEPRFLHAHTSPPQFLFPPASEDVGPMVYTNIPSATIRFAYDGDPRRYFGPGATVDHPTNSIGFRGPEFARDKPAGGLRIAFVGDSFTFGEGVHFEDTYAERTAALLSERCGRPVESLNFGVGGFNTLLERLLLERQVLDYAPDAVVLGYVLNDAEPPRFKRIPNGVARLDRERELAEGASESRPPEGGVYRLRVARWIWKVMTGRARTAETVAWYRGLFERGEVGWLESRRSLVEMAVLCRRRGIPFVVLCFPILVELDGDYPFAAIHDRVGKVVEGAGGTFVDLLPTFRGRSAPGLWVHPTDQHPNEIAHELAAGRLVEELIASGALPCPR